MTLSLSHHKDRQPAPAPAVLAVLPDLSDYDRPQEASSETKGLRSASTSEPGPPILRLRNAPKRGAWRLRWLLLLAACIGGMLIAQRYVGRPPTPPHSASGDTFATRHAPPPARTASATREVAAPR